MAEHRYVALLRGINVGGSNLVKMVDLKAAFEALGFESVRTYIQSGNVVFATKTKEATKTLVARIETALSKRFGYAARMVVVSTEELRRVIEEAPKGFGKQPTKYRYDVLFLRPPLKPKAALAEIPTNPAVDRVSAGRRAVYFERLMAKATHSRMSRIVALPIYKQMTIRNWNTTTKLLALATSE
jgi:uncharacterized protein (DUF1697 family)